MKKEIAIALVVLLAFGCISNSIEEPVPEPRPTNASNTTNTANTSPFFYVSYKTNEELGAIYRQLKNEGFGGCNVEMQIISVEGGTEYKNSTSFEPNSSEIVGPYNSYNSYMWDGKDLIKNRSHIRDGVVVGDYRYYTNYTLRLGNINPTGRLGMVRWGSYENCSVNTIFLGGDRGEIKRWFVRALVENSEITGLDNEDVRVDVVDLNWSGRIIDIRLETEEQKIAGYSVVRPWGDSTGRGNVVSARLMVDAYNGTRYYTFHMYGSYYPEPRVSVQPQISLAEAKTALVQQYHKRQAEICSNSATVAEIAPQPRCDPLNESMLLTEQEEWVDGTAPPKSTLKIRVEENDTAQRLEYRLIWDIWIKRNCKNNAHIDAITGELLNVNDYCMY